MRKTLFLIVAVFGFNMAVSATNSFQYFEDVFITYEYNGEVKTHALNKILINNVYSYKLYFGEVSTNNYELYVDSFLKGSAEEYINCIIYYSELANDNYGLYWYYLTQMKIYEYLYSDYEIYFSDSEGNKIDYHEEEMLVLESYLSNYYVEKEETIYNNQTVDITYDLIYRDINVDVCSSSNGTYSVSLTTGSTGKITLVNNYNVDKESSVYVNSDNNILFSGGGSFEETTIITYTLDSVSTIVDSNPVTGNNPFLPILIGVPTIILGCLVYIKVKDYKDKKQLKY